MEMPIARPKMTSRSQAITDIIESVALEQKALSRILDAEAEKIHKVVNYARSKEEILEVNHSVHLVLNAITRLELVLQAKLEMFQECLCCDFDEED